MNGGDNEKARYRLSAPTVAPALRQALLREQAEEGLAMEHWE
jgi:hypothetical protein